jgi:hypothetical protein
VLAQRSRPSIASLIALSAFVFLLAVGVRCLHWQDKHIEIVNGRFALSGVFTRYQKEARRILDEGRILFPRERSDSGDARILAHPPGYSIVVAAVDRLGLPETTSLWALQIFSDACAAVLVLLIGLELFRRWVAVPAALLVAVSPHLSYYTLFLSPDSLTVPPILLAVYLVIRSLKKANLINVVVAGALIGISCWLNANAMLLSVFLAAVVFVLFERQHRTRFAVALLVSTIVVISSLTIRNLIVFHRFIPISIQAGLSLAEGIGDYDRDGLLGMPRSDREARQKDAEWNNRPDYGVSLWNPDGIDRDRTRLERGLAVVRSKPGWFLGVMLRRAGFMLSYNDTQSRPWPINTASVPPIFSEPGYGHPVTIQENDTSPESQPAPVFVLNDGIISGASIPGDKSIATQNIELANGGMPLSPQAAVSEDFLSMRIFLSITGDRSEFGDQYASAAINVKQNTDYVLVMPAQLTNGSMALKVTSEDRRISLAQIDLARATSTEEMDDNSPIEASSKFVTLQMPFATGDRNALRIVVSNNGKSSSLPSVTLKAAELRESGPTPYAWTKVVRGSIRSLQRRFTTGRMLVLIVTGIVLLLLARRWQASMVLLTVPVYYLLLQSPLHTEYRYILPIHYFLFILAGVTIGFVGAAMCQMAKRISGSLLNGRKERRGDEEKIEDRRSMIEDRRLRLEDRGVGDGDE